MLKNYDAQLKVRSLVPDFDTYIERGRTLSAALRRRVPSRLDCAYGPGAFDCCDIFLPQSNGADRPVHVFFHGGYWRAFDKSDYSYVAEPLVAAGAVVVIANYALLPAVSMEELIGQCRRLIGWLYAHASEFGGSRERITISGHSAGGHIAAVLHLTAWDTLGLPRDIVRSTFAVSGLYDLQPVLQSFLKEETGLTEVDVRCFSPIHWLDHMDGSTHPITLAVGANETPEMQRQSRAFGSALRERGVRCDLRVIPHRHHMNIVLDLADAETKVGRLLLKRVLEVGGAAGTAA